MDLKTHEIYFEGKKQVVEEVEKSNIMNQESVVFKKIIWLRKKTLLHWLTILPLQSIEATSSESQNP